MPIISQYTIVCQVPGAEPYTIMPYSGVDLTQILGITQANLPYGHYGWIQECGKVRVIGQIQAVYADFSPNSAKPQKRSILSRGSKKQNKELPSNVSSYLAPDRIERLSQLPPLLMEDGPYCSLIREARDVYVDGHFYACVAMCGISLERFQRDKAKDYGAMPKDKMEQIRNILKDKKVLLPETFGLCKKMADLRNVYAHGQGRNPDKDALKALSWMHTFLDKETSLMRDYIIVDGILNRKSTIVI